jgi:hypothetical protein
MRAGGGQGPTREKREKEKIFRRSRQLPRKKRDRVSRLPSGRYQYLRRLRRLQCLGLVEGGPNSRIQQTIEIC